MSTHIYLLRQERMYNPAPPGKKRRVGVGWVYTWSTTVNNKQYNYSRAILDKDRKSMIMPFSEWEHCTEKTAEQEINKAIEKDAQCSNVPC